MVADHTWVTGGNVIGLRVVPRWFGLSLEVRRERLHYRLAAPVRPPAWQVTTYTPAPPPDYPSPFPPRRGSPPAEATTQPRTSNKVLEGTTEGPWRKARWKDVHDIAIYLDQHHQGE